MRRDGEPNKTIIHEGSKEQYTELTCLISERVQYNKETENRERKEWMEDNGQKVRTVD